MLEPIPYASLAEMKLVDVLRLIRSERVGPHTFFKLIRKFGSAADALKQLPELSRRAGGKPLVACELKKAEQEITAVQKFGARMIRYGEEDYPELLHHIADPPPIITVLGDTAIWKRQCIGMVGARNASANGRQFAKAMARQLGQQEVVIVSGLARGIDTFAHQGALESGTVAVIAGGIDNIYPPENESLYREIAEKGAIISEQPFGQLPFSGSFPGRNRIITGMSEGVVVVEASVKSGSLISARFAAEQGREVCAVPGFPLDPRASGCNRLLRDGATLVENAADVLAACAQPSSKSNRLLESSALQFTAEPVEEEDEITLQNAREEVMQALGHSPVLVDELLANCQLTSHLLFTALMELELAGKIHRHPGNRVSLALALEQA